MDDVRSALEIGFHSRFVASLDAVQHIDRRRMQCIESPEGSYPCTPALSSKRQLHNLRLRAPSPRSVCTCCTPDTRPPRTLSTDSIGVSHGDTVSFSLVFSHRPRRPTRNAARSPFRSTRISEKFQQSPRCNPLFYNDIYGVQSLVGQMR